ncbi:MAG: type II secretion system secretin GspD [Methylococcales bacterium]|nr:type II secretion system secretin GspD [Methylococcales bacterium]
MIKSKNRHGRNIILLAVLLTSGCDYLGPDVGKKIPLDSLPLQVKRSNSDVILYENQDNEKPIDLQEIPPAEIYPGTGAFISDKALNKKQQVTFKEGNYNLNFTNAEIDEVTKVILGEILKVNYVISPQVKGSISIKTTKPIRKSEVLSTLDMLLKMNGAAITKNNNIYHIEPIQKAHALATIKSVNNIGKLPAGHQLLVVPLEYVSVTDMAEVLKGILSESAILRLDKSRNVMVIAGHGQELAQAVEMIKTFDVNVMEGMSFGLFPLQKATAETVITELEAMLETGEQSPLNGLLRFVAIERLNAIMAVTPQVNYLKTVERWIARLDKTNTTSSNGIIVYPVKHVDAEELANTLTSIISGTGRSSTKKDTALAPGSKAATINNKQKTKPVVNKSALKKANSGVGIDELEGINIVADVTNNSLIIVASPVQYEMLKGVISQLDVMPLQVLIDATIISVTLTDELRYGIRWYFTHGKGGSNGVSSGTGVGLSDLAALAATAINPGFGYSFASSADNVRAVLTAEAKDNKINVISAPSLMVLNNQEAVIQVGEQIPVRTSELTTDTGTTSNTIQMRETGVTLKVKPRVNANGLVIMEIEQSVDNAIPAGSDGSTSQIDSPSILQRKIKSIVAVQDKETIVLGGLISENKVYNKTGIPLLNQIPVIGGLFGSTEKTVNKTELVILITPRVIRTRAAARDIALEFKQKLTGIFEELPSNKDDL